jgi:polyphenol oxidase
MTRMAATATLPALPAPFAWQETRITGALPGAGFVFSTRLGGISEGPYASLNLGRLTHDPDANVRENRRRLCAAIAHPWERVCYGRQVHGARVRRTSDPPGPGRPVGEEDGQAIARDDLAALVFVADCLPIVVANEGAVAVLHGGWRPLAAGIVAEGVAAVRALGGDGPLQAALGPSARGCCYEVGEEVHARFAAYGARVGERNLDLAAVAATQLRVAGVEAVHDVGLCTMCCSRLFFSHRRDRGVTGRQAGVAWRA